MRALITAYRTAMLCVWFCIYLPWIITGLIIDVLESEGPEFIRLAIIRHRERRTTRN